MTVFKRTGWNYADPLNKTSIFSCSFPDKKIERLDTDDMDEIEKIAS